MQLSRRAAGLVEAVAAFMFPSTFPAEACDQSDSRIRANLTLSFFLPENDSGGVSLTEAKLSPRARASHFQWLKTGLKSNCRLVAEESDVQQRR